MKNSIKLVASIVLCEGAGFLGTFFTTPAIPTWYAQLAKPTLAPPNWVFAPVWTTLFLLMGIAFYLVWTHPTARIQHKKAALMIFGGQLVLNILWSAIFFGLESPRWALVEIMLLWCAIIVTMIAFRKISLPAAWLLVPYILWVSFAGYLNYAIWSLN